MGDDVYECEVVSTKQNDNLRSVFNYVDDLAGREIKDSIDTYVVSYKNSSDYPANISINSSSVSVDSVLEYTTWDFDRYNYGFKTLTGEPTRNLDRKEAYLNLHLAKQMASIMGCKEEDLIGTNIQVTTNTSKGYSFFVVDILINTDDSNLGPYFLSQRCLIMNYNWAANYFTNLKHVSVLRSGYLAKNYAIHKIEGTISLLNKDSTYYYSNYKRLINNKLIDDGIQALITNTYNFYRSQNKIYLTFSLIPVAIIIYVSLMSHFRKIKNEILVALFTSVILYAVLVHFVCPFIVSGGTIILLANTTSSFMLILDLIIIISVYYLFKPSNIATDKNELEGKEK